MAERTAAIAAAILIGRAALPAIASEIANAVLTPILNSASSFANSANSALSSASVLNRLAAAPLIVDIAVNVVFS